MGFMIENIVYAPESPWPPDRRPPTPRCQFCDRVIEPGNPWCRDCEERLCINQCGRLVEDEPLDPTKEFCRKCFTKRVQAEIRDLEEELREAMAEEESSTKRQRFLKEQMENLRRSIE
jgi:hypothetical protein